MKKSLICALVFLVTVLTVSPLIAAPVTLDTALPVTEGEGIFRVQGKYTRSTDDPGPQDREFRAWEFPLVLGYGITERLAVFGIVPFVDKELEATTGGTKKTRDASGLGDISLITRFTVWQRDRQVETVRVAPFIGIKAPTGEDDEKDSLGRLPQPVQPGTGSWDPSVGLVITSQTLMRQVDASLSYTFNTEANDFRFGDVARFDLSYQHRLWPYELSGGVPAFVYGVLESNLIRQDKNEVDGTNDRDSGGTTWYLTPGIQYVTKRIVLEGAVQIPVVQDLNGDALKNDFVGILSFRANF